MEHATAYPLQNSNKKPKLFKLLLVTLIIIGLLISSYLLYRHSASSKIDVCSAIFGKGCDSALNSSVGTQLGLPLAGWGIIFYSLMILILLLPAFLGKAYKANTSVPLFALSFPGCIGSITLVVMMLFNHTLFCPFCFVIHIINLLLLFCIIKVTGYSIPLFFTKLRYEIASLFKFRSAKKDTIIKWLGIGTFLLLTTCFYVGLQIASDNAAINPVKIISEYNEAPREKIQIYSDDPIWGPVNSPIQIITFSDFECPSCRGFSKVIQELKKKYKDKFYLVFKHFPLGTCNPIVSKDIHPKACEAALASEAARQQGKFWEYHDVLFFINLGKANMTFSTGATIAGLDSIKFEKDRRGDTAKNRLAKTIQQGINLKIDGTPAVYVNGRMVNDFRLKPMEILFDHLLNVKK